MSVVNAQRRAAKKYYGIKQMFDSLAQRAFAIFEMNSRSLGRDIANWNQAERELFNTTHVDISESDQGFTVRAEVPGFASKELEVNIESHRLTISGRREKHEERKDKKMIYSEQCSDQVLRVVDLPAGERRECEGEPKGRYSELDIPKAALAKSFRTH